MKWIVDTSGYPDVETRIGKDYFDSIRDYAKHIRQYPKKVNYKFVCKENDFVDKMIFIISGLYNEYKNNECDSFYCADKEIQQKLNFSKKVYELSLIHISRLSKDENVSTEILSKICSVLSCDVGDIVEFVPDKKENQ